jgi:hypothetical protein
MKITAYLLYAAAVLACFAAWALVIFTMRNSKTGTPIEEVRRTLSIGPAHLILRKRDYKLTKREIIGWGIVALFMLLAPWLSWWLSRL